MRGRENYTSVDEVTSRQEGGLAGSDSLNIDEFPKIFGFSYDTHASVLDDLDRGFEASLGDLHDLVVDGVIPASEAPSIEVGEYMKSLRNIDGRTWHDREVDALFQRYLPEFNDGEWDMLLAETSYNTTPYNSDEDGVGTVQSEIDFMAAIFDDNQITADVWEAKTHETDLEDSDQKRGHEEALLKFSENTGIETYTLPRSDHIYALKVDEFLDEIGENCGIPKAYYTQGDILGDSIILVKDETRQSDTFRRFIDDFVGIEYFSNPKKSPNIVTEVKEVEQEELMN